MASLEEAFNMNKKINNKKESCEGGTCKACKVNTQPKYDLFFKAGALFQNSRVSAQDIAVNDTGTSVSFNNTIPEVLPEIKLGGAYHVTDKLLATLSWMHAFGGTFNIDAPITESSSVRTLALSNALTSWQSPVLNSVMFGLEYRFG